MNDSLDRLCIDTLRFLAVDAVQKADSGHPGMPLGAAPMAYALWARVLKFNPRNPDWPDRDRFVLSAGHGSMLLYGLLHLTGYDLLLDDIKAFRQWGSNTPGHFRECHVDACGERHAVVVVQADQLAEFQMPGQRGGFCHHAFHQVAIADDHIGVVVDHRVPGPVVARRELRFANRHAHRVGEALTQRTGGDFDGRGVAKVMNAMAARLPALTGGSADLDTSTKTALKGFGDFNPPSTAADDTQGSNGGGWSHAGRNLHFGVREHAMGAIVNGLAAHGGFIPYGATFLIFCDYMRPGIRLAALMKLHVVHVFTHDSLAVGEDGPTHQPVEQLASLRAMPGLTVIRPADANETAVAWKVAVESRQRPVLLALTRQDVPTLDRSRHASAEGLRRGAYVLSDAQGQPPGLILIASGSEVALILAAAERLQRDGIAVRCVSMPSWDLFDAQPQSYRDEVLPASVSARLAVELGATQGWHRYVGDRGDVLGIERFGSSAPADILLREYGFTIDNVASRARALLSG